MSTNTEGSSATLSNKISNKVYEINSSQRKKIHLAAVFACNFSNHMYAIAEEILKEEKSDHKKLIYLLSDYTPLERQNLLREVDEMILRFLKIKQSSLPWLNSHKKSNKNWEKLSRRIRLILSKIHHEHKIHEGRVLH